MLSERAFFFVVNSSKLSVHCKYFFQHCYICSCMKRGIYFCIRLRLLCVWALAQISSASIRCIKRINCHRLCDRVLGRLCDRVLDRDCVYFFWLCMYCNFPSKPKHRYSEHYFYYSTFIDIAGIFEDLSARWWVSIGLGSARWLLLLLYVHWVM